MVYRIGKELAFPDPRYGDDDGLIAVGGDLSVDRLLLAYSNGIFPWYSFRDRPEIMWYCPMQRFVIFPSEIHISHSMRNLLNKGKYSVGMNEAFDRVIGECSRLRYNEEGAWLGEDMMAAYKDCIARDLLPAWKCGTTTTIWWAEFPCSADILTK